MDYGFTADMERNLDEIASGNLVWRNLLEKFSEEFEQAKEQAEDLMERNKPIDTQVVCDCGNNKKMQLRTNQSGQFLGCEAFVLEGEEQCKKTLSLLDEDLFSDSDDKEAESIFKKTKCDVCNSAMDGYIIDNNRNCLLYTSPSPRDAESSRMPSSA